ncbi:MAG: 3-hydroxybutyryl-CoA dehydratase [Oceanospirillaceae bacterium]|uniref:MaoC/PaaZ C-terminal domain-containing protein n=1 Tax=unclassified Thalassolituus TaxID=2624967 RepID=UPI000C5BB41B|nr:MULTISPECIES: MaoC/PaaZ C-terminal domain-containing protein [unclassified Thalassolituus]MAX99763.1 3-hydroxybutyryl-CoA dehydratase [Oceanospirillaceae bacterium]MBS54963.1 3-hydroxybutyryl-CoA dehydratase [Oceanospirillaceae bacterium]|tara:strand:+ start:165 stop:638 length:474 start_codon:yes stop_codon:yes gene_type:complete
MNTITNRTFDEISVGDRCERHHTVTEQDLILFAAVSGDHNPLHLDAAYAATTQFKGQIAHGMFTGALISAALAMDLPGPGTIYLGQNLSFRKPVMLGDELTVVLEVASKHDSKPVVTLNCTVTNQDGKKVATGEATVMAPVEKMTVEAPALPAISVG